MSETADPMHDPISALRQANDRIAFLEKQMEAVMNHLDAGLPPGVARAWPRQNATPKPTAQTPK